MLRNRIRLAKDSGRSGLLLTVCSSIYDSRFTIHALAVWPSAGESEAKVSGDLRISCTSNRGFFTQHTQPRKDLRDHEAMDTHAGIRSFCCGGVIHHIRTKDAKSVRRTSLNSFGQTMDRS